MGTGVVGTGVVEVVQGVVHSGVGVEDSGVGVGVVLVVQGEVHEWCSSSQEWVGAAEWCSSSQEWVGTAQDSLDQLSPQPSTAPAGLAPSSPRACMTPAKAGLATAPTKP